MTFLESSGDVVLGHIWDEAAVQAETDRMAEQLAAIASEPPLEPPGGDHLP